MAPEQFQGRALPASDVYAIGATALSLLTGREPEDLPHKGLGDRRPRRARATAAAGASRRRSSQMLDPDPDRRAARIAPVLAQLEGGSRGRADSWHPEEHPGPPLRSLIGERLKQQAAEYEERAYQYEDRASAGGPGAYGWRRAAEGWHRGARKLREEAHRHLVREAREADQRERRRIRKEARHAARARRHASGTHRPPWPIALFLSLLFAVGMVAVALATQVIVPTVLRFLSLFFASRGLKTAANAVREAGDDAMSGIRPFASVVPRRGDGERRCARRARPRGSRALVARPRRARDGGRRDPRGPRGRGRRRRGVDAQGAGLRRVPSRGRPSARRRSSAS